MTEKLTNLDAKQICRYLRNRRPFLMLDRVEYVIPGKNARGYKNLSINEWFFEGHFPGCPLMPGALQLEAIFNLAGIVLHTIKGNEDEVSVISRLNDARFLNPAVPGDKLDIEVTFNDYRRGVGKGEGLITVDKKEICKTNFTIVIASGVQKLTPVSNKGESQCL